MAMVVFLMMLASLAFGGNKGGTGGGIGGMLGGLFGK